MGMTREEFITSITIVFAMMIGTALLGMLLMHYASSFPDVVTINGATNCIGY